MYFRSHPEEQDLRGTIDINSSNSINQTLLKDHMFQQDILEVPPTADDEMCCHQGPPLWDLGPITTAETSLLSTGAY